MSTPNLICTLPEINSWRQHYRQLVREQINRGRPRQEAHLIAKRKVDAELSECSELLRETLGNAIALCE
jgi:hypothetical protein